MTYVCLVNIHSTCDQILDSGVANHITCCHTHLHYLTSCHITICLPNGHFTVVKFKGRVQLTSDITLYDVLHIPEF